MVKENGFTGICTFGCESETVKFPADVMIRNMEIFVDRRVVEIYLNGGEAAGTKLFYNSAEDGCFCPGGRRAGEDRTGRGFKMSLFGSNSSEKGEREMKKRAVAILLAAAVVSSMASGCGSEKERVNKDGESVITIWSQAMNRPLRSGGKKKLMLLMRNTEERFISKEKPSCVRILMLTRTR